MTMMTRRSAILIGLGLPAGIALSDSSREFWNEKKRSDWTADEIQQLLTKSPWARDASVAYYAGPGAAGRSTSGVSSGSGRRGRTSGATTGGTANPAGTIIGEQQYKAVVRWESALPIREASHSASDDDPLANYILSVMGDLPMLGTHPDEDQAERDQRAEMLKQYTKIERKNDPIYLAKVNFQGPSGTLFYFSRQEPIYPDDRQVTFTTKLGPLEVKAKFTLKEMFYQGKLAL